MLYITRFISAFGKANASIIAVPSTPQNLSTIILPDNKPIYEGSIIALSGIEMFLNTYFLNICIVLKPFVLVIST